MKALIVEKSSTCDLFCYACMMRGFEVVEAENVSSAWSMLQDLGKPILFSSIGHRAKEIALSL